MRFFEQVVLVDPDEKRTVIERRYNTGEVEYWSAMEMDYAVNGQTVRSVFPFQIKVSSGHSADVDGRAAAFEHFDASMEAAKASAKKHIQAELEKREQKARTKIILANAIPATPMLQ